MGFGVHQAPSSVLRAPREEGATCRAPGDPRDRAAGLPAQLASVQCGPCPSVFTWFKLEMSTTLVWTTASASPGRRLETQGPAGSVFIFHYIILISSVQFSSVLSLSHA